MLARAPISTGTNPMPILAAAIAVFSTVALAALDLTIPLGTHSAEPSSVTLAAADRAGAVVLRSDPNVVGSRK